MGIVHIDYIADLPVYRFTEDEKEKVEEKLEEAHFKAVFSEVTMKADNEVVFAGEDAAKMQKLLDALEELDDVQDVYTSAVIEE